MLRSFFSISNDYIESIESGISDFKSFLIEQEKNVERALLRDFALGEQLGHKLAYQASQHVNGQKIHIKEADGISREYIIQKIHTGHGGIVAEIFKPCGTNITSTMYVNFTGTHNAATIHADLEYCPGEKAFQENKHKIMSQINAAIGQVAKRTGHKVKLVCAGHSLGAAYAQQCIAESLRYQVRSMDFDVHTQQEIEIAEQKLSQHLEGYRNQHKPLPENNHFFQVDQISLLTWNAAGVSKPIQDYSNQIADLLIDKAATKIKARFGMVDGDAIQLSGEGTVLSDSNAEVANLEIDCGISDQKRLLNMIISGVSGIIAGGLVLGPIGATIGGILGLATPAIVNAVATYQAHTAHHFNKYLEGKEDFPKDIKYKLLLNNTDEGHAKIKARVEKKAEILQTPFAHAGLYCLRKLGDLGACIKQPFKPKITSTISQSKSLRF